MFHETEEERSLQIKDESSIFLFSLREYIQSHLTEELINLPLKEHRI